jgi:RND family efflux transporter MFP subunit
MTRIFLVLIAALALAACERHPSSDHGHGVPAQSAASAEDHGHDHGPAAQAITDYTGQTELFVEFPPLVAGQESPFAAHLTWTSAKGFKPVTEGRVTVVLSTDSDDERFEAKAPSSPGIFRPVVKPQSAGKRQLVLQLESGNDIVMHLLGEVEVYADAATAARNAPHDHDEGSSIAFLKEQQWKIAFATAAAARRPIRETIPAQGVVRAAAGGEALVIAPASGVIAAEPSFPRIGQTVRKGELLAYLTPRLGGETDAATLDLALQRSRLALDQARRERERLEGLFAAEAIPERRVIEARNQEQLARAELESAQKRLAPYQGGGGGIALRAPVSGTVADVKAAAGAAVEAGQPLFHIADLKQLWLEARIPESQVGRIRNPSGAWFRIPGFDQSFDLVVGKNARLVAFGGVVDKDSRSVPLILAFDNPQGQLRVGMAVQAHVLTDAAREALAVPASALTDDAGQMVAFVQKSGEAFERRTLVLGVRDGDFVEVKNGLAEGERVVTLGAYDVRLAATAPAAIGHGHAH